MTREEADFIGGMNMCDEISNEAYKKIMCHCEEQEPILDKIFCIVHPLSIMSTPELEHKAIMQITEMLEPLCLPESETQESEDDNAT